MIANGSSAHKEVDGREEGQYAPLVKVAQCGAQWRRVKLGREPLANRSVCAGHIGLRGAPEDVEAEVGLPGQRCRCNVVVRVGKFGEGRKLDC